MDTDSRNEFLLGILERGQGKQPGVTAAPSPESEMDDYEAYYGRVIGQLAAEDKMREEQGE